MILQIMLTYLYFYLLAFFPCAFEYISCPYISFEIRMNYNSDVVHIAAESDS